MSVTMAGGVAICVEVDPKRIQRRLDTKYLDVKTDSLDEAIRLARATAEQLAGAAGVTLGPVLSLNESGGYRPQQMFAQADMARSTPVAEGTISLSAQVQMVYAIE